MNLKMWANFLFWRHGVGCSFLASCTLLSVCHLPLKLLHQCISPSYSIHSTYTRHQSHNIHIMLQYKTLAYCLSLTCIDICSVSTNLLFSLHLFNYRKCHKPKKTPASLRLVALYSFKAIALYTPFLYVDLIQELT